MIILFVIFRHTYRHIYRPRTCSQSLDPHELSPEPLSGWWNWVSSMYHIPDSFVSQHHSMDAYLILRFLKLSTIVLLAGVCAIWPILLPVNVTGGNNNRQLDKFSISNIAARNYGRLYVHSFTACCYIGMKILLQVKCGGQIY